MSLWKNKFLQWRSSALTNGREVFWTEFQKIKAQFGSAGSTANILSALAIIISIISAGFALFQTKFAADQTNSDNIEKMSSLTSEIQRVESLSLTLSQWEDLVNGSILRGTQLACNSGDVLNCPSEIVHETRSDIVAHLATNHDNSGLTSNNPSERIISGLGEAYNIKQYMIPNLSGDMFSQNIIDALSVCGYVSIDKDPSLPAEKERWAQMRLAISAAAEFVSLLQGGGQFVTNLRPPKGVSATSDETLGKLGSALDMFEKSTCGLAEIDDLSKRSSGLSDCKQETKVIVQGAEFLSDKLTEIETACEAKQNEDNQDLISRMKIKNDVQR